LKKRKKITLGTDRDPQLEENSAVLGNFAVGGLGVGEIKSGFAENEGQRTGQHKRDLG